MNGSTSDFTDHRSLLIAAADLLHDLLGPAPIVGKLREAAVIARGDELVNRPNHELTDEEILAKQAAAEVRLGAAVTGALDAYQRLDDDDFLDTFVVVCRIGSTEVNSWHITIENNEPRDVVIGLCRIGQRQAELATESHALARAVADRDG